MNGIIEFLKHNAKAIAGFVAGLIISAVQAVISGQAPWPKSLAEWGQYLGLAVFSGIFVWATGNKLTASQITRGAVQQGITVITNAAIDTTAQAAEAAVHKATQSLPAQVGATADVVAHQVSDVVTHVLKGVADNFPQVDLKNVV